MGKSLVRIRNIGKKRGEKNKDDVLSVTPRTICRDDVLRIRTMIKTTRSLRQRETQENNMCNTRQATRTMRTMEMKVSLNPQLDQIISIKSSLNEISWTRKGVKHTEKCEALWEVKKYRVKMISRDWIPGRCPSYLVAVDDHSNLNLSNDAAMYFPSALHSIARNNSTNSNLQTLPQSIRWSPFTNIS